MTTQSKGQKAALLRVKQIRTEFLKSMSAKRVVASRLLKTHSLDTLGNMLDEHLREIAKLVEEHGLNQYIVTDSRSEILNDLFEEAGSREDHAWQARFAKKYGL